MPRYRVMFTGRTKGAIGILSPVTLTIAADSADEATRQAYETHEHLHELRVTELCAAELTPECPCLASATHIGEHRNGLRTWGG